MSLVRDPDAYDRFEHVVVAHSVRLVSDLGYRQYLEDELPEHELVGEQARRQLRYYPTVTREPFRNQGRLTTLIDSDKLGADLGLPPLDPAHDRVMICGGPKMLADLVELLERRGFEEGNSESRGHYVIERAFVEK
jgi:ferredoxin--NADP+ reductase